MKSNTNTSQLLEFHSTIPDKIISRESSVLEFKESFNWGSRNGYAKSMAAFANYKGGRIVFGVTDSPRILKGLSSNNFEDIDEEKITSYLNSVFSPEIQYSKSIKEINSKKVGVLEVFRSENRPVVCIKNDGDLKESDIYYRYIARSERIKYPDLKLLLDQITEKERKSWMTHFENISKIGPMNAAVLDVIGGKISGNTGTLVIDKSLIPKLKFINEGTFKEGGKPALKLIGDVKPVSVVITKGNKKITEDKVQLTSDPTAPLARIDDKEIFRKYPLSYANLTARLRKRYYQFKTDGKFQKLKNKFITNLNVAFVRYLDPNNLRSTKKVFYSPLIIKKFDKYYKRKRNKRAIRKEKREI